MFCSFLIDVIVEWNKLNKKFQYDNVGIIAITSTLNIKITILRSQYLGLRCGYTSKHLRKFICEVVPTNMMTYVDSFGVVKTHLLHGENMSRCQRVGPIDA